MVRVTAASPFIFNAHTQTIPVKAKKSAKKVELTHRSVYIVSHALSAANGDDDVFECGHPSLP